MRDTFDENVDDERQMERKFISMKSTTTSKKDRTSLRRNKEERTADKKLSEIEIQDTKLYEQGVLQNSKANSSYKRHIDELKSHFDEFGGLDDQIKPRSQNPKQILDKNIAIRRNMDNIKPFERLDDPSKANSEKFKLPNFNKITKKDRKRMKYTENT